MSSINQVNEKEKPIFWFTPSTKTDKSEYDRMVDEDETTLHLITPNDSLFPFLRLRKVYLDKSKGPSKYVTNVERKKRDLKNLFFVFVLEEQKVSWPKCESTQFSKDYLRTFTNMSHHIWCESLAKSISGKLLKIGTLKEDDHNLVKLNVAIDKLLAEKNKDKSINLKLVHALEVSKKKEALLEYHDFIGARDIAKILGSKADNVSSFAYNSRRAGKIFSVEAGRKRMYPLFQFNLERGEIRTEVSDVLKLLPESWNDWDVAFWFFQDNAYLDGEKPFKMLVSASEEVINAAKYESEKLNG
jgi:hypothetical protein